MAYAWLYGTSMYFFFPTHSLPVRDIVCAAIRKQGKDARTTRNWGPFIHTGLCYQSPTIHSSRKHGRPRNGTRKMANFRSFMDKTRNNGLSYDGELPPTRCYWVHCFGEHWVEFLISLMGVLHWINYTYQGARDGRSGIRYLPFVATLERPQ